MKTKVKLKPWVRTALLLLPKIIIIVLLFLIAFYLRKQDHSTHITINFPAYEISTWSDYYE